MDPTQTMIDDALRFMRVPSHQRSGMVRSGSGYQPAGISGTLPSIGADAAGVRMLTAV